MDSFSTTNASYHQHIFLRSEDALEVERQRIAEILNDHWGGGIVSRLEKLRSYCGSYILVQIGKEPDHNEEEKVIHSRVAVGHVRIETACFRSNTEGSGHHTHSGQKDGVLTSVIIDKHLRSGGIGKIMMSFAEAAAKEIGYGYLYLWTSDAQEFYRKAGYAECARQELLHSVSKMVNPEFLRSLMSLSIQHRQRTDTVGDRGSEFTGAESWFRKRILESRPICYIDCSDIAVTVKKTIRALQSDTNSLSLVQCLMQCYPTDARQGVMSTASSRKIPWAAQIGPSCGIAALRMAAYLLIPPVIGSRSIWDADHYFDLIKTAQEHGLSVDGEFYDINNLNTLVNRYFNRLGVVSEVYSFEQRDFSSENSFASFSDFVLDILTSGEIIDKYSDICSLKEDLSADECVIYENVRKCLILPYDRDSSGDLPGKLSGQRAHYAIINGAVVSNSISSEKSVVHEAGPSSGECTKGRRRCKYLIGHQGLSSKPIVATLESWFDSNAQLLLRTFRHESRDERKMETNNNNNNDGHNNDYNYNLAGKCLVLKYNIGISV